MTQITLQTYLRDIEKLIDDNRLTEAVAHCKHILRQQPRYIEAYRLLSKALLEQHEYVSAADVFQRILSADPEDFIAHVGLSIVHKAEDLINEAIWHMERAYEVHPYNSTIQHELRDLYAWRDGELKTRELQLTPIALARLHFNAELYQQAVAELRSVLKEQPDRVDVQSLLAEALWRDDQRVDAVEICLQLLETLPHCIKANAILSEIWLMTGRIDEAQEYLQKLQGIVLPTTTTLNEDTPVAHAFSTDGAISVPHQIAVEKLDRVIEEEVVLTGVPDWVDELGLSGTAFSEDAFGSDDGFNLSPAPSQATEDAPEWLRALTTPASADQGKRESADVLDWLREVASGDAQQSLTLAEDLPSPNTDSLENEAALPDWLTEVLDGESLVPPVEPLNAKAPNKNVPSGSATDEEWLYDDQTDAPPGLPDWMNETPGNEELHAPKLPDIQASTLSEFPDWLQDVSSSTPQDDNAQLSDWLDTLAGDETTPPTVENRDLPDWFGDLTTMNAAASAVSTPNTDVPDWLAEFRTSSDPPITSSEKVNELSTRHSPDSVNLSNELPDWFSELTTPDEPSPVAGADDWVTALATTSEPASETDDAAALPDWFSNLNTPDEPSPAAGADDWVTALSTTSEPTSEIDDAAALPDWFSNLSTPDKPTPAAGADDWVTALATTSEPTSEIDDAAALPDWFSNLSTPDKPTPAAGADDWVTALATTSEPTSEIDDAAALPDWFSNLSTPDEPSPAAGADDWVTALATTSEPTSEIDDAAALPDWLSGLTTPDEPNPSPIPVNEDDDWLSSLTASAEMDTTADAESENALADWLNIMPTNAETSTTREEQAPLPDWLSGLTQPDEPDATVSGESERDSLNDLSTWLQDLSELDEPDETGATTQKKTEFITAEETEAPSALAEATHDIQIRLAAAREITTMADSPPKDPKRPKGDNADNELNWLDELANLPLDEPSTVPNSSSDLEIANDNLTDWLPEDEDDLSDTDSAWLDALSPAQQSADQTLDWLDQMDQPEVEEAPTLSWLSDEDLRGQASNAFSTASTDEGEDLEEAMAWLESLVTDQDENVLLPLEPTDADSPDELDWLNELDSPEVEGINPDLNLVSPTEEAPTITESIPDASAEETYLSDLFSLEGSNESPEQVAAAMSWLDELANAGTTETSDNLISAGLPPEDPEAAMAWLEQLAAAQADEVDDEELESPMGGAWDDTNDERDGDRAWLEQLADTSSSMSEIDETFLNAPSDLEQPLSGEAPDWLNNLADLPADETIAQPIGSTLPNWLDELASSSVDEIIPSESLISAQSPSEPIDWLDEIAAADEPLNLETPDGETLPNWFDELTESAMAEELADDLPIVEQTAPELPEITANDAAASLIQPPAEATYVPPTHISAEAAKILDMSDLFEMDDVEESEEDMAQAMAWMQELIGDMGTTPPAVQAVVEDEPIPAEPSTDMDWLAELAETPVDEVDTDTIMTVVAETPLEPEPVAAPSQPTYVPPTHISAEAAKILDMNDLFEMDDVEESEEDMAQAMAWMQELIGDLGQPAAAVSPSDTPTTIATPVEPETVSLLAESAETGEEPIAESMAWLDELAEPVSETPVLASDMVQAEPEQDEAMAWLDEIVAEIGNEPVAAASSDSADEAMDWLNEIVADMTGEPVAEPINVVEEAPTPHTPEPAVVEPIATQPAIPIPPTQPTYVPPTHISAEAAKILDMSDLFAMDDVEESEEDMAQAMAWMQELIGDMGTPAIPVSEVAPPELVAEPDELPTTIISATPIVEDDSALSWLNNLAVQDEPISALPNLDEPFTIDDLETAPATPQDEEVALDWLEAMTAEQSDSFESLMGPSFTSTNEDLLDELTGIPEDPDAAMDWLDQMAAQQGDEPATMPTRPVSVIKEVSTPAVPVEVMDALVKVETKRQKAQTGPLKLPELPQMPPDQLVQEQEDEDIPFSLISELTSGDVAESLPDWLSLDAIGTEEMPLSWLRGRDLDATGWLESEEEMVDAEPVLDMPFTTPSEPVIEASEPQRRETEAASASSETMAFAANLDVRADDGQLAVARQLLQTRKYEEAISQYSGLLEQSASISPLITELETVVDSHPAQPLLRRLLGDAYMRNGQLQKALETYRKALDQL